MKTSGGAAINVEGLQMRYGETHALRDLTFQISHGEVVAILGPNGAGKTTTIEVLEGFRAPSAGRVEVLGADPLHAPEMWRARVGIVLQSWRDHNKWRVRELLTNLGSFYGGYATARTPRPWDIDDLLSRVGLSELADKQIRLLSGGQRRRLDVAIGIVGRPELLFLDEPTTGFDPEARREFHELIEGLAADDGTTIVLTTHDLVEAERLADRVMILDRGEVIADGSVEQLARQLAGTDEVSWTLDGQRFVEATHDSTRFVFDLFVAYGEAITDLDIHRSTLEDTYLTLVQQAEQGRAGVRGTATEAVVA